MQDYLTKDLKVSVVNDVSPCLLPNQAAGGYFSVPRFVLSYVDYLGALYHGYNGQKDRSGRRIFASSTYAKAFLHDVFGAVDQNYRLYGDLLWEIYRHGTVHLYEPLRLSNQGRVINWAVYKGRRTHRIPIQDVGVRRLVTHLVPEWVAMNEFIQPVSTLCLYQDLLNAIDSYSDMLTADVNLQNRFRNVTDALQRPESTNLTWW